jgi:integrator complex subunit 9
MLISKLSPFVINFCSNDNKIWEESAESILNTDEHLEEREKLSYLCSCATDSLEAGGSVLISINRVGVVLQLLEQISASLESLNLKVDIYSFCFG